MEEREMEIITEHSTKMHFAPVIWCLLGNRAGGGLVRRAFFACPGFQTVAGCDDWASGVTTARNNSPARQLLYRVSGCRGMLHVAGLLVTMLQTACLQAGDAVITAAAASTSASAPMGQRGQWRLLFSDEFDGLSLDSKKWVTCYWWNQNGCTNLGNRELQWYRPQNVTVTGGQLHLRARREAARGHDGARYEYTSGLISTGRDVEDLTRATRFDFRYGYVEMRARIPAGRALFPALWMMPADHESKPEIDIMEVLGQEPRTLYTYFHYRDDDGVERRQGRGSAAPDLSAGWHVFAADWQPDRIVWYLDGVERWRYQSTDHIPNMPMYILINLAVGGIWPGSPDSSTRLPADLLVDYVRVWRRVD